MNHKLRQFAISNRSILILINKLFRLKNKQTFHEIINKNKNLPIFDYKTLITKIPYYPTDLVIDNNLYGLSFCLKKYANLDINKSLDASIEHGLFIGNLVRKDDIIYPVKSIITYENRRITHLKNSGINKSIIPIGPYIHYATPLLSEEEYRKLKEKLGKVLLVFPSHGIINVNTKYDIDNFIADIESIKSNYDTVLVSLYWADITNESLVKKYIDKGYLIVTSGHRYDLNFLSRQRSIIELADFTMSNSIGTHIGYCIYLGKPHYVFQQEIGYSYKNKSSEKHFLAARSKENYRSYCDECREILSYFNTKDSIITYSQKQIVDEFWGTSWIRTPLELSQLLPIA